MKAVTELLQLIDRVLCDALFVYLLMVQSYFLLIYFRVSNFYDDGNILHRVPFTYTPHPPTPSPQHSSTSCTNHFSAEIVYLNLFCIFFSRKKRKKVWQQWKSSFVRKRIKEHSPKSALLLIQATSCGNWSMTSHPCCPKFPSQP